MFDDFAPRLAQILTEYSQPIQAGDYVLIMGSTEAEPLIRALYEAVLRRGGNPSVRLALPGLDEALYALGNDDQLSFVDPLAREAIERADVMFRILAPYNTKHLSGVAPERSALRQQAQRPIIQRYFERTADGSLRWNICGWPTQAAAQQAEMGLLDYTEFVYKASALDKDDPIAHWQQVKEKQARLVKWLEGKKHAEVRGPGIELSLDFEGRTWISAWGDNNFPDGEIFTSPVKTSVNGHVEFSFPTVYGGREVSGVKLTFKDGKVVEASAEKNEAYLLSQLEMDEGARFLGEFAIGTNYGIQRFTGEILFDEKIGGTIHMALGQAFEEAGGTNKSLVHWDMIHEMKNGGSITIDGTLFYENGQFVVEG